MIGLKTQSNLSSSVPECLSLPRLDLVGGSDPPAFRRRNVDGFCSKTPCGLVGSLSAGFPRAVGAVVATCAPGPGSRICRGGRRTFESDVPPHSGLLVRRHPCGSLWTPQARPSGPDDGEAGRRLVRACCRGTHSQVGQGRNSFIRLFKTHGPVSFHLVRRSTAYCYVRYSNNPVVVFTPLLFILFLLCHGFLVILYKKSKKKPSALSAPLLCLSLRKAVEEAMDPGLAGITAYVSQDCTGMKDEPAVDKTGSWAHRQN